MAKYRFFQTYSRKSINVIRKINSNEKVGYDFKFGVQEDFNNQLLENNNIYFPKSILSFALKTKISKFTTKQFYLLGGGGYNFFNLFLFNNSKLTVSHNQRASAPLEKFIFFGKNFQQMKTNKGKISLSSSFFGNREKSSKGRSFPLHKQEELYYNICIKYNLFKSTHALHFVDSFANSINQKRLVQANLSFLESFY